jgi:uncharacterized protein with HEPN domain
MKFCEAQLHCEQRHHVLRAHSRCNRQIEVCTAIGRERFLAEWLFHEAAIRQFEIIGEATKRLSPELRNRRSEIDWRRVAGLRDVLIHNYMGVDLTIVWDITQETVPELKRTVEALLAETGGA